MNPPPRRFPKSVSEKKEMHFQKLVDSRCSAFFVDHYPAVVQRLVENGDAVTATEYAARCGMEAADLCSDEDLARAARERRDAHLQLPDDVASAVFFVDDEEGLKRAAAALSRAPVVGLDTEWSADFSTEKGVRGDGGRGAEGRTAARGGGGKRSKTRWKGQQPPRGEDKRDVADATAIAADAVAEGSESEDEEEEDGPSAASVVALLQVATETEVFLLDLPALLRRCPHAVAPTLGAVLANPSVLKAGFGVAEDLRRLAVLHPVAFGGAKRTRAGRRRRAAAAARKISFDRFCFCPLVSSLSLFLWFLLTRKCTTVFFFVKCQNPLKMPHPQNTARPLNRNRMDIQL